MKSGGDITLQPSKLREIQDSNSNGIDDEAAGAIEKTGTDSSATIDDNTSVSFNGIPYKWSDLREMIRQAWAAQKNVPWRDTEGELRKLAEANRSVPMKKDLDDKSAVVREKQQALEMAEANLKTGKDAGRTGTALAAEEAAIKKARQELLTAQQALRQQLNQSRQGGASESQLRSYGQLAGEPQQTNGGGGTFRAQTFGNNGGPHTGPAGGQPTQGGAKASTFGGGPGGAGGFNPFGAGGFDGLTPPSSAAYAASLYFDSQISEGMGQIGRSQREGQRLMMLFFYYARMAASGDLGAMYEFFKFLNYIISKDKALQNVKIGSKLIQLQDLSRKATEALMQTPTDDPDKIHEFTKAMHKAKSEETMISTSQKLLADMSQEFAHVVEAMTNSSKFLLDAWGRVLRTVTRP